MSQIASKAIWLTERDPTFLPDEVDGRYLFNLATEQYRAQLESRKANVPDASLGDIVMVEPVRQARERGVLNSVRTFDRFEEHGVAWPDGTRETVDAVIWCTGFRPALSHLAPLGVLDPSGRV